MGNTRKCPCCGEEILSVAKKCKYCGEWLNNETAENVRADSEVNGDKSPNKTKESLFRSCFFGQKINLYCIIIIVVMVVVAGLSLFYFSGSPYKTESDYFSRKEEAELRKRINEIQMGLNDNSIPFIDYCSDNMKKMYNSVEIFEKEYGVECECVKTIRQIDSDYVVIEPTEFYKFLLLDEETGDVLLDDGSAVVNLKFDHYSDQEVSIHFNIERSKSWFSRGQIKNVVIDGIIMEDGSSLYRCMKDWVYVIGLIITEEYEQ